MIKLLKVLYPKAKRGLALVLVIALVMMDTCPIYAGNTEEGCLELTKENLSDPDNYKSGWYKSWGGEYEDAGSGLCSTKYYIVRDDEYIININNSNISMDISEYDQNKEWTKHNDKIYDGSTFTKQSTTKYIMITFYSTVWGVDLVELLENGLEIEFVSTKEEEEQEQEAAEPIISKERLSNPDNYIYGWYKSWGGEYETTNDSACTEDYLKVVEDRYYVYYNDSRVVLAISEYDADKNWLKYSEIYSSGSTFTKQADTEYVMITIFSSVWGVDPMTLLEYGLEIDFSTTVKSDYQTEAEVDFDEADFAKVDNWKAGTYSSSTGGYGIDTSMLCYGSYIKVDDDNFIVNLPDGYLRMNIIELDSGGNVVDSNDYSSGQHWQKGDDTEKIAITMYTYGKSTNYTIEEYKAFINDNSDIGLVRYSPSYTTGSNMKELTASQFVKNMNVGWNLGNSLDAKGDINSRGEDAQLDQELGWGNPYVAKSLIDYVAQSGFNTIRIPVTWYYNTYTDSDGNLHVGQKWLERVQEVVDYAMANDMYVIINSHHDQPIFYAGVSEDEIEQVLLDAGNLWQDVAEYFKDYDEHLIFESYNEIDNLALSWNYSDTAADQMNRMNQVFVDTVRGTGGNNAERILMVPTLLDGYGENFYNAFVLPADTAQDKLVVTVHSYAAEFNQDLEGLFTSIEEFSDSINAPIIIGEFGTTNDYFLSDYRTAHASNFVGRAAEHGIKCIWWDNGSNYAIVDRRNLAGSDTAMIKALMEGANGVAYEVTDELVYDDIAYFTRVMPNLTTGELENLYWGTLTTTPNDSGIPVTAGDKCMINLTTLGEAQDLWLQRILFYDEEGNYLSGQELQMLTYIFEVPENAAYMKISLNSAYRSVQLSQYTEYLSNGDLKLTISTPKGDNVRTVQLKIK
jgi:aryl-phospho-beta-D-glucosidase BglC (GH1 family)